MDLNNFHLKKHEKVISPTRLPEISIYWKEILERKALLLR